MHLYPDYSLKAYNTFGLDAKASHFARLQKAEDLSPLLLHNYSPIFILGGGSNVLFVNNFEGLVIHNEIGGIAARQQLNGKVIVEAGGGVNWHQLVCWCLDHDLGGIENLSLIPGTAGAAPIQNIGAYGVELKDVFYELEAMDLETGKLHRFKKEDCDFAYRNSIFKQSLRGKVLITRILIELTSISHNINTSYGAIRDTLAEAGIKQPTIKDVSEAVIKIRTEKLPDPLKIGNAGSFFKNPEISQEQFEELRRRFPNIVHYPGSGGLIKVPAGWLIEQCGWKGYRSGAIGCYEKQALVLVNYGGGSGNEIWNLAQEIIASVEGKFGIQLNPEVNILG
ncbi:MAG: UDP-N-acetylenolpyruvoylglucosamine reductase [Saprospiraceae bacterium]|nr:MAG: UDP-N-acetylenolpyruvoylglucosamine reductase [Saprospiraceae bacterium]